MKHVKHVFKNAMYEGAGSIYVFGLNILKKIPMYQKFKITIEYDKKE